MSTGLKKNGERGGRGRGAGTDTTFPSFPARKGVRERKPAGQETNRSVTPTVRRKHEHRAQEKR